MAENRFGRYVGVRYDLIMGSMANLLIDACRQVNAAARINDSEATRNAVSDVNDIIAHYKAVVAQPAHARVLVVVHAEAQPVVAGSGDRSFMARRFSAAGTAACLRFPLLCVIGIVECLLNYCVVGVGFASGGETTTDNLHLTHGLRYTTR